MRSARAALEVPTWDQVTCLTLPISAASMSMCATLRAFGANSWTFPATRSSKRDPTGPAAAGDLERRAHGRLQLRRLLDQEDVLGAGTHDVEHGRLLEGVGSDGMARHLPADEHDRD